MCPSSLPMLAFCAAVILISFSFAWLAVGELTSNLLIFLCSFFPPIFFPSLSLSLNTTNQHHTHMHTLNHASHVNDDHSWQCMCGHAPQNRAHHRGEPSRPLWEAESWRPHPGGQQLLHHQQVPFGHREPHQGGREHRHTTHHSRRR